MMKRFILGMVYVLFFFGTLCAQDTTTTSLTFNWNSNTEENLAGYGFYFSLDPGPPYDLMEDGIPPSTTETVTFRIDGLVVNINEPTYFTVDAYDTEGNRSGFSEPCSYIHCVEPAPEMRTLSCAIGYTGNITETRTATCSFNSYPVWGNWIQTSNTCRAISTCVSKTETRTIKCDKFYYKGSTIQTRTLICNPDGTSYWTAWKTVSSTCRPWWNK